MYAHRAIIIKFQDTDVQLGNDVKMCDPFC